MIANIRVKNNAKVILVSLTAFFIILGVNLNLELPKTYTLGFIS